MSEAPRCKLCNLLLNPQCKGYKVVVDSKGYGVLPPEFWEDQERDPSEYCQHTREEVERAYETSND